MKEKKLTGEEVADKIALAVNMDKNDVIKIINKKFPNGLPYGAATLKRRVEKKEADKVRDLKLRGVIVSADTKRYYPNNNFLSHVLGHTNSDGDGLTGVEFYYNKILSGKPGIRIAETDRKSKDLPYTISSYVKPEDGNDLVLTIDEMIQHFCEKSANQAMNDNGAKAVTIMVMNPNTGEILALVNKPDYNPNDPWQEGKSSEELQKMWRNRAVNDTFEPGSIFKVVTAATAMEENVVSEKDTFNCGGSITIGNRTIHCWKRTGHGLQHFPDILKNSCNVGFAELGKKIGKENLNKYIQKFGFGKKTGIDLPGEAKGIIKKTENITDIDVATISFGQANTVSSIQFMAAFNAVANGGRLIRPHVMKNVAYFDESQNKEVTTSSYKAYENKILDSNKMATLRGYLERVVSEGGGKNAFIEGYHIAGKTGTAQKAGKGGYQAGKYVSSFAGMAPANDPKITVFVSVDEPDPGNYYASQVAAPVAKQLFNDIFNYLSLKPDATAEEVAKSMLKDITIPEIRGLKKAESEKILKDLKLDFELDGEGEYVVDMNPKPGYNVKEGTKIILYTGTSSNYNKIVVVPDIKGLSPEGASKLLNSLGLKFEYSGKGMVSEQSIEPGKEVKKGTVVSAKLSEIGD